MEGAFPMETYGDAKQEYRAIREGDRGPTAARAAAAQDLERQRRGRTIEDWDPREELRTSASSSTSCRLR